MKREFLKSLGLDDEVIDKIMAEHGKAVQTEKDKAKAELDTANGTIGQLQEAAKKFDGVDVDKLKSDFAALQKKYDDDTSSLRLSYAIDAALTKAGAKNNTAVKALLASFCSSASVADDGSVKGLTEAIDNIKNAPDTAFLFESAKGASPIITGLEPAAPSGKAQPTAKDVKDMSYDEFEAYIHSNTGA